MNRTGSAERWRRKEARHDNGKWYYAHLRWAVMVEAKEGLRKWEDAVQIFLSEDRATAFQRTLQIGYEAESCQEEGRGQVENRLAQLSPSNLWAATAQSSISVWGQAKQSNNCRSKMCSIRSRTSRRPSLSARGRGNDGPWKAWKTMKLFSHSSHRPWKSLRRLPHFHRPDYYGHDSIPKTTPTRWGQFGRAKGARSSRQNQREALSSKLTRLPGGGALGA